MAGLISRFLIERGGAIAAEYALAAGLVGLVVVLALVSLGHAVHHQYEPVVVVTAQERDLSHERDF